MDCNVYFARGFCSVSTVILSYRFVWPMSTNPECFALAKTITLSSLPKFLEQNGCKVGGNVGNYMGLGSTVSKGRCGEDRRMGLVPLAAGQNVELQEQSAHSDYSICRDTVCCVLSCSGYSMCRDTVCCVLSCSGDSMCRDTVCCVLSC
jgi:hypothetical protein